MPRPWLYPFELHTRSEIVERYGALPEKVQLEEDAPDGYRWPDLGGVALPEGYEALLDGVLTRVNIGSPDRPVWDKDESHLLWGTPKRDIGDSFSVWLEDGHLETVGGMFDLTDLNSAFVELVLFLGQRADQVLVCTHSEEVVEPTPEALAKSVRSSVSTSWQGDAAELIEQLVVAVRIRQ
jgi:hypothetical protein